MAVKKVMISMPEDTYQVLLNRARKSGMSFSAFMTKAAMDVERFKITTVRSAKKQEVG